MASAVRAPQKHTVTYLTVKNDDEDVVKVVASCWRAAGEQQGPTEHRHPQPPLHCPCTRVSHAVDEQTTLVKNEKGIGNRVKAPTGFNFCLSPFSFSFLLLPFFFISVEGDTHIFF